MEKDGYSLKKIEINLGGRVMACRLTLGPGIVYNLSGYGLCNLKTGGLALNRVITDPVIEVRL